MACALKSTEVIKYLSYKNSCTIININHTNLLDVLKLFSDELISDDVGGTSELSKLNKFNTIESSDIDSIITRHKYN